MSTITITAKNFGQHTTAITSKEALASIKAGEASKSILIDALITENISASTLEPSCPDDVALSCRPYHGE